MAKIRDTSEGIIKTTLVTSHLNVLDDRSVCKKKRQLTAFSSMKGIIEARIEQTAMVKREIASVSVVEAESVVTSGEILEIDIILVSVMKSPNTKMRRLIERVILTQEPR